LADRTKELVLSQGKLDVAEAEIIVPGGRGLKVLKLGVLIEILLPVFMRRPALRVLWSMPDGVPHSEQVGQTGQTVSPTMYIAVE